MAQLALLVFAIQALFVHEGQVAFHLLPLGEGMVPVTTEGLRQGAYVAGRLLSIILLSYLFVVTTDPSDLAQSLMQAGLPYRYGFALVIALRLLPGFELEANTVYNAQRARGVRYDVRSPGRLLLIARQLLLPLLVSSLRRVDTLAVSMESRCFGLSRQRTFWRPVSFSKSDIRALAVLGVAVAGILVAGTAAIIRP